MADYPCLPLWTDAYLGDTMHLNLEQHGAYLKLLMIAWRDNDCSLPADDLKIARMLGITRRKWESLRTHIMPFWTLEDGRFYQKKLTLQRQKVSSLREKKVAAGVASAVAKSLKVKNRVSTLVADALQQNTQQPPNTEPTIQNHIHNQNQSSTSSTVETLTVDDPNPNPFDDDLLEEKKESSEEHLRDKFSPELGQLVVPDAAQQLMRQRAQENTQTDIELERETLITQFMIFHISRENAEALHDGARKMLERRELAQIVAGMKSMDATREQLQEAIGEAVLRRQEQNQKTMHNANVQIKYLQAWGRVAHKLRGENGEQDFQTWIKPVRVEEASDHNLTLRCSKPVASQIQSAWKERIIELWKVHTNDEVALHFVE